MVKVLSRISRSCLILFIIALVSFSCKKKKAFKNEDGQASVEVRNAQAEESNVMVDINRALAGQGALRSRSTTTGSVFGETCGMLIDTSQTAQGIVRILYDGTTCSGRKREGGIILTVQNYPAAKLKTPGSVVQIDFAGYKVTKASGSTFELNGTMYMTNESGGTWYELIFLNQPALIESLTAENLKVTLNNNATVLYTVTRRSTYTFSGGVTSCTEEGTGSHNGKSNVETWGYTREKIEFTSRISTPVKWTTACSPLHPLSGEVNIQVVDKAFELDCLYGLDVSGNGCPSGWKTSWTYKNDTRSRSFNYDD